MNTTRAVLTALASAALATSLAACGASSTGTATPTATPAPAGAVASATDSAVTGSGRPSTAPSPSMAGMASRFDDQDVAFASDMIDHHRQAVQMAKLTPGRTTTKGVLVLAEQIEAAQGPEITMMSGWLTSWGKPIPEDMGGMDMGGSMPGMLSAAELQRLTAARGAGFDKLFLTMMIAHHQGAVTMAKAQLAKGDNPEAIALARKVVTDQTAQIRTMQAMLR